MKTINRVTWILSLIISLFLVQANALAQVPKAAMQTTNDALQTSNFLENNKEHKPFGLQALYVYGGLGLNRVLHTQPVLNRRVSGINGDLGLRVLFNNNWGIDCSNSYMNAEAVNQPSNFNPGFFTALNPFGYNVIEQYMLSSVGIVKNIPLQSKYLQTNVTLAGSYMIYDKVNFMDYENILEEFVSTLFIGNYKLVSERQKALGAMAKAELVFQPTKVVGLAFSGYVNVNKINVTTGANVSLLVGLVNKNAQFPRLKKQKKF